MTHVTGHTKQGQWQYMRGRGKSTYSSKLTLSTSVITNSAVKTVAECSSSQRKKSHVRSGDDCNTVNLLQVGVEQSVQFWSLHSQKDVGNWKKPREG